MEKPEQFIGVDGAEYLDTARNIIAGHGYAISQPRIWDWDYYQPGGLADYPTPEVFRPPMYSIVIAAMLTVTRNSTWPIAFLNAALSTLAAWFLFDLARRACRQQVAEIALLLYSLYPLTVVLGAKIGAEALFGMFLCASLWALWRVKEGHRSIAFSTVAGLSLGLAILTRSNAIFLGMLGCIWLFNWAPRKWLTLFLFTLTTFVTLLPWAARNRLQTGQWIFLSGSGGYNLWLGNNEVAYRMFTAHTTKEYDDWGKKLLGELVPQKARQSATNDLGEAQRFWYQEASRFIREHPGQWCVLIAAKFVEFWRPYVRPGFFSTPYVIVSWVTTVPLLALGWWGIFLLFRDQRAFAWLLVAVMLAGMIGLVLSHVHVRLRVPFVDTFFVIPAAIVLHNYGRRLWRSNITSGTGRG